MIDWVFKILKKGSDITIPLFYLIYQRICIVIENNLERMKTIRDNLFTTSG